VEIVIAEPLRGIQSDDGGLVMEAAKALSQPRVRGQAMEAISYMFIKEEPGSRAFEEASAALVVATRDPSPEVGYCAANTIGSSGHLPLVPVLEALLGDRTAVPGWVGTVAEEPARSLVWIVTSSERRKRR
jgi:hypothetical protein